MNKTHFFLFAIIICFLSLGCDKKRNQIKAENELKINNVAVVIDYQLWNGEVGDSIRNKFASPVLGLPQEEALFTLNQFPVKLLEGFMTNSRNIIVVKKENTSLFSVKKDQFLKPQVIIRISGKTVQEILDSIQSKQEELISVIRKSELKNIQENLKSDSIWNDSLLAKKFKLKITLPKKYKLVMFAKKFLWFKKEIPSGNLSLAVYELPYSSLKNPNDAVNSIIRIRDSIGNRYIHGSEPNTKMITEKAFSPYLSKTQLAGRLVIETKGNWELEHDSMSGPFINYLFLDSKNKRIIVLEGFCYAPSKQKRDLMFELEGIIKSVQFLKFKK
jgi:hypothetical protein